MTRTLHCEECGAALADGGTCIDQFHALLAAEAYSDVLRQMHGLTVLTYYLQHPSLTKPWYQAFGRQTMRRIFVDGENWLTVLLEEHPRGVGRQRSAAAIARRKAAGPDDMPEWVVTRPIPGELHVTAIDADAGAGHAEQVLAWARSVAEHRFL